MAQQKALDVALGCSKFGQSGVPPSGKGWNQSSGSTTPVVRDGTISLECGASFTVSGGANSFAAVVKEWLQLGHADPSGMH